MFFSLFLIIENILYLSFLFIIIKHIPTQDVMTHTKKLNTKLNQAAPSGLTKLKGIVIIKMHRIGIITSFTYNEIGKFTCLATKRIPIIILNNPLVRILEPNTSAGYNLK